MRDLQKDAHLVVKNALEQLDPLEVPVKGISADKQPHRRMFVCRVNGCQSEVQSRCC